MIWDDEGFLISKNRYSENSLIVEIFTKNYGKVPGIIFGGTSRKIKNYLQLGNQLYVNYSSKTENKIGNKNDTKAAHKLVTSHLRLVAKIAMGYRGYGLPVADLIAEGNIGMMHAVKKFDPEKRF